MKYDFDQVIDRIHSPYSYSLKWADGGLAGDLIKGMCGLEELPEDRIALFTADMDFKCAPQITEALVKTAQHGIFGYSVAPKSYYEAVSRWFADRFDWHFSPENVIMGSNATHDLLARCVKTFTKEGEGVIVLTPSYSYHGDIEPFGRKFVGVAMVEKDAYFTIDFDAFEAACADKNNTMFIACHPHNPTGRVFTPEEITRLGQICEKHGVLVVSDEVHIDIARKGQKVEPFMKVLGPKNTITATGINKTFNVAGLAMSNLIIADPDLYKTYTTANPSFGSASPFGITAVISSYTECDEWVDEMNAYYDKILNYVVERFHKDLPGVKVRVPEGTYVLWFDFSPLGLDDEELSRRITSTHVLIGDGAGFDPKTTPHQWRRMCLTCPMVQCEELCDRFARAFADVK